MANALCCFGALLLTSGSACAAESTYKSWFRAKLDPATGLANAYVGIEQTGGEVIRLTLRMPADRYELRKVDGHWRRNGDQVTWEVPRAGGRLRYQYRIESQRENGAFDARLTATGGLFRGDDLFPSAVAVTKDFPKSIARVRVDVPEDWVVHTQYGRANNRSRRVHNPERRFDRPTGWMIAGRLGVRIDTIAERTVVVAGFVGDSMRRNDILAFLRWNLPELLRVTGQLPPRLLIVGADDPFWRGGLSASRSFYLHVDRPMISGNGTSPILHELTHIASGLRAAADDDWLVEGLAEYYSLEIMRRTGTISDARFAGAIADLQAWGAEVTTIATPRSAGAVTARAVVALHALAQELAQRTAVAGGLDAVMRALTAADEPVTFSQFLALLQRMGAGDSPALARIAALVQDPADSSAPD